MKTPSILTRWLYCGVVFAAVVTALAASPGVTGADSDGDGATDAEERLAGTDPASADSVFRLLAPPERAAGAWRIRWSSVAGRIYHVERAADDDLASTNWVPLGQVEAVGPIAVFDDTAPPPTRRYYRVRLGEVFATEFYRGDPERFVLLDAGGRPAEGAKIPLLPDGSLAPFEFRPAGRSLAGAGQGLFLRFPAGARVTADPVPQIRFTVATLGFGPDSPLQLAGPLEVAGSEIRVLSAAAVDVGALASLFGRPAGMGLDVVLFGRFPLRIVSGVIEEGGLRGARLEWRGGGLALPGMSGNYAGWVLDLLPRGGLRIPFAGAYALPDGSTSAPQIVIATNRPLWVELRANGDIGMDGRAAVAFPGGPSFAVDFGFDEALHHLAISATGLHLPLLDALAELLPPVPPVPGTDAAAALDAAAELLRCFDRALERFSASAVAVADVAVDSQPDEPSAGSATASSVLEAWAWVAACSSAVDGAALTGALAHAGGQAVSASSLKGVLAQRLALLRLQQAQARGNLTLAAAAQAELDKALRDSTEAVIQRAASPEAVLSLGEMRGALRCLLEVEALRQALGQPFEPRLTEAMRLLLERFTASHTARLEVQAGVFTPVSARIQAMDRFEALESLRAWVEVQALADGLGVDVAATAPVAEAVGQLALRLWEILGGALLAAEANGDLAAFTFALEDALEFIELHQSGLFPVHPALASLPGAAALDSLATRLGAVLAAQSSTGTGTRGLGQWRREMERLLGLLRRLPAGASYPTAFLQRTADEIEVRLAEVFGGLDALGLVDLKTVLAAGMAREALVERFALAAPVVWFDQRLPQLVARFAMLARAGDRWSDLHEVVNRFLTEADRYARAGDRTRQRSCLTHAATLAGVAREVGIALWRAEEARRGPAGLATAADMALPGDIRVDRVAGWLRYDGQARSLAGGFSGRLRLPGFNASLTVDNATLTSGGAVDLMAHGSAGLPSGAPGVQITIPARRPLRLSVRPPDRVSVAAGVTVALNNGLSFGGYASLADPVYGFGVMAEGLRFDLATNALVMLPAFPATGTLTAGTSRLFNEYFESLAASLEPLAGIATGLELGEPGTPPEFHDIDPAGPGTPLRTFAAGLLLDATNGVWRSYAAVANAAKSQLAQLAADTRTQRDQLEHSEVALRGRILRQLCQSLEVQISRAAARGVPAEDALAIGNSPELQQFAAATVEAATRLMTRPDSTLLENRPAVVGAVGAVFNGLNQAELSAFPGNYSQQAMDLLEGLADYLRRSLDATLRGLGLDATTGRPGSDAATFMALPPEALKRALTNLVEVSTLYAAVGQVEPSLEAVARQSVAMRYRHLQISALTNLFLTNATHYAPIGQATYELLRLHRWQQQNLFAYPAEPILQLDGSMKVTDPLSDAELQGNFLGKLNEFGNRLEQGDREVALAFLSLPLHRRSDPFDLKRIARLEAGLERRIVAPNSPLTRLMNRALADERRRIEEELHRPWVAERLADGVKLLEAVNDLALSLQAYDPGALPGLSDLITTNLNLKMIGSARLKTNAWWLHRYVTLALDAAETKVHGDQAALHATWLQASEATLRAGTALLADLGTLLPMQQPVDLRLPGDLLVRRAAGAVTFNRQSGAITGEFSGRLEFVESDRFWFEISRATLDNQLNFSIDAATAGPLPFGGVRASATLAAQGGPQRPFAVTGTGLLLLPDGPEVAARVSFDTATRLLTFDAQGDDLEWRLSEHLALFDAAFGFTAHTSGTEGELRVSGSAGFFARGAGPAAGQPLLPSHFELHASDVRATIAWEPNQIRCVLGEGTLHLPEAFYATNLAGLCPAPGGAAVGASVRIDPAHPLQATIRFDTPAAPPRTKFSGEFELRHFGFELGGIPGLAAAVCSARLRFADEAPPYFTNVNAALRIPLPASTNHVDLEDGAFTLEGYPSGRIELREDLVLADLAGFRVIALGQGHPACPQGSSLTVLPRTEVAALPAFRIDGGLRVIAPAAMLTGVGNDTASGLACGGLVFTNGRPPRLEVGALQFGGTFHLGGAGGLLLRNAVISLEGIEHALDPSQANPFRARVEGQLAIPNGPALTLTNAAFTFFDPHRLPRFTLSGVGADLTGIELVQSLPATIDRVSFTFKDETLELPELLAPSNLTLTMSAHVSIPPDQPVVAGQVDNIRMSVRPDGLLQVESIAGLLLRIGGLNIPPIEEIGGELYIGGLADPLTGVPTPEKMYFAGRAEGSYNGYKLGFLLAFNLVGPIGMCLDVNAGSAGIPIDGYQLGGVLVTGAAGGISFLNNGKDPCAFTTYMGQDGAPLSTFLELPAALSWSNLRASIDRLRRVEAAFTPAAPAATARVAALVPMALQPRAADPFAARVAGGSGVGLAAVEPQTANDFDCPGGCPPATVNIFCQPHPDAERFPNRIIGKFSSIDERTLNDVLGIKRDTLGSWGGNAIQLATNLAHTVRQYVQTRTPALNPTAVSPDQAAEIAAVTEEVMAAMEQVWASELAQALATAGADLYAVVRDTLYAGAPCPDITLIVTGTLTHQYVSSFLSGTGGVMLSSAGNAGVVGHINFLGIPTGTGRLFVAATDENGDPNPSVCGEVEVAFGPLDLGVMRGELSCRDCVTGFLREFHKLALCLGEPIVGAVAARVAPRLNAAGLPPEQLLRALTDVEKAAFMAELYQLPPGALEGLPECFIQQFDSAWSTLQPYFVLCGVIEPKLFGLPLSPRLAEASAEISKTNIAALTIFSPSQILAWAYNAATVTLRALFPFEDIVTLGFNVSMPDPGEALLAGMRGQLATEAAFEAYTARQFDYLLERATYTSEFELKPLGGKGLNTQARVVMPNLTNHPARPGSGWRLPERIGTNLLSREDLLLTLLEQDKLVDPFWTGENLGDVDPRLSGYSFRKDYFPHGGFLGAAKIAMPRALTETPPDYLPALLDPGSGMTPVDRVLNALDYAQNYLASFTNRGSLAFYVPAPNPPFFTNAAGQNLGPRELLTAISTFDARAITNAQVAALYPFEVGFIKGYFNATLLGVPMATGIVVALPPAPVEGRPDAVLRVEVAGTPQGWLAHFVETNNLIFELKQAPLRPIETWANEVVAELAGLAFDPNATRAELEQTAQDFLDSLATNLPKARLEADLALRMPLPIRSILDVSGTTRLHAYSPRYEPLFAPGDPGPLARARREGGIALQADARLKIGPVDLVHIENAELALVPRDPGLPEISARLVAPVIPLPPDAPVIFLREVAIDLTTEPQPRFRGEGRLDAFSIGSFQIAPADGFRFGGSLEVTGRADGLADLRLALGPAALLGAFGERWSIHGANRVDPFTFSTAGPWTASIATTNRLNLLNLIEVSAGGVAETVVLEGEGTRSATFTTALSPGADLTLFPAHAALRRTVRIAAAPSGSLTASSDGRFRLHTQLGGDGLALNNITVPGGASLVATNEGLAISWNVTPGTTATLGIDAAGRIAFDGQAALPPLALGIFRLSGVGGGDLVGSFNNDGFVVTSGAELRLAADWLGSPTFTLSSLMVSNNGAIAAAANIPAGGWTLAGYGLDPTSILFTRAATNRGGTASLALSTRVRTTGEFAGFPSLVLTGSVSSTGAVTLEGRNAATTFFGYPVRDYSHAFTQSAGQFSGRLDVTFALGDGSAPRWDKVVAGRMSGTVYADASFDLSAEGSSPSFARYALQDASLRLRRSPGGIAQAEVEGTFAANGWSAVRLRGALGNDGAFALTLAAPASATPLPYAQFNEQVELELTQDGLIARGRLNQPPLPPILLSGTVARDGGFQFTGRTGTGTLAGLALTDATVSLQRLAGGATSVSVTNAQLAVPGFGTRTFSGQFTNDGSFRLTATIANPSFAGLPFTDVLPFNSMSGNAQFVLTHEGLRLIGSATGGVLTRVPAPTSVEATVHIGPGDRLVVAAAVPVGALVSGQFTLRKPGGASFDAILSNEGLTLPAGAELLYRSEALDTLALPPILVRPNGDFEVSVGEPVPVATRLVDWSLTNVRFLLRRTGSVIRIEALHADLTVPTLNTVVRLTGDLANSGTFTLSGSVGSAIGLSGLPANGMRAGATLTLNQSGDVQLDGQLTGSIFQQLPGLTAAATVRVSPAGGLTLSGTASLGSFVEAGVFRLQPAAPGALITASWVQDGLRVGAENDLRLWFNGAALVSTPLPAFTLRPDGSFEFGIGGGSGATVMLDGFAIGGALLSMTHSPAQTTLALQAGNLNVPGLATSLEVGVRGSISRDGSYLIEAGNALPAVGIGVPRLINVNAGGQLRFENGLVTISGALSGGVLDLPFVQEPAGITGGLRIAMVNAAPVVTPFGQVPLASLDFGALEVRPPAGAAMIATLESGGLRLPIGTGVWWLEERLGAFTLPEFVIDRSGVFNLNLGPVAFQLQGFALKDVGLTLERTSAGLTTLRVGGGARLVLKGLPDTPEIAVGGVLNQDAGFAITNSANVTFALPGGFPIGQLTGRLRFAKLAAAALPTLALGGSVAGGVLANVPLPTGGSATGMVTIASSGDLALAGRVVLARIAAGPFSIEGAGGGNLTADWHANGLRLNGATIRVAGVFGPAIALAPVTIPASGVFQVPFASPLATNVVDYPCTAINGTVVRRPGFIEINPISARLKLTGFNQTLTGSIGANAGGTAAVSLEYRGSLALGGFSTIGGDGDGVLRLSTGGLEAEGSFKLHAANQTFHAGLAFAGSVEVDGGYSLQGTGQLSLPGLETLSADYTLTAEGVSGSPKLKYGDEGGKLEFQPDNFALTSTGVGFSKQLSWDQPLTILGRSGGASFKATATLSQASANGTPKLSLGGDITVGNNTQNLSGTLGTDLEFAVEFPPAVPGRPAGPCVRFDLAPLRAKLCGMNWPQ